MVGGPPRRRPALSTGGAYAVLLVGLLVVGLAWWLTHSAPWTRAGSKATPAASAAAGDGAGTAAGTAAGTGAPPSAVPATAHWVIDGDTLDIDLSSDGTTHRLRLLNIDAPELEHPGQPLQCQAQAATSALVSLAPKGTTLRVLIVGQDGYGRDLGEAWLTDGRMLGAEIAREGLAAPITIGGRADYREVVDAARDEAAAAQRGLHDPTVACSLPAKVADLERRLAGIPAGERATLSDDALRVLDDLTSATPRPGVEALTAATRADLTARVRAVVASAHQLG